MALKDPTSHSENWQRLQALSPELRAEFFARLSDDGRQGGGLKTQSRDLPALEARAGDDEFPLTGTQQAYWIGRGGGFGLGDVSCFSYVEVDVAETSLPRIEAALNRLISHHPMLRAVFSDDGSQTILPGPLPYEIVEEDLSALDDSRKSERLGEIRQELSHQVLPSNEWPLFKIVSSKVGADVRRLHIGMDALIFDGWSIHLFLTQWGDLCREVDAALPPQTMAFRDYVSWQEDLKENALYQADRDYWLARVEDLPPAPKLPLALEPQTIQGVRFHRRRRVLGRDAWARVKKSAAGHGVTPTGILLAAYAEVLALWSEEEHFTINIPRFNRPPVHEGIQDVLGEFASFTLLEVDASGTRPFSRRVKEVQEQLWRDLDHSLFNGLEVLRERARVLGSPEAATMPVIFTASAQNEDGQDAYVTTAARNLGEVRYAINQTPQVWLDNHVAEQDGELICDWDFVDGLLCDQVAQDMLDAYFRLLTALADDPAAWDELPRETRSRLIPKSQLAQRHIINSLTAPVTEDRLEDLVFKDISEDERRLPAVFSGDEVLTYDDLDRLTKHAALTLAERGVEPGDRVGILMTKGWQQPVAVLAVLRCRAVFVPVDAEQPLGRTARLLEDAGVRCVLTVGPDLPDEDWPEGVPVWDLDELVAKNTEGQLPQAGARDDGLACIIYTSGSTGAPKGVMVSHRNIANTVLNTNDVHQVDARDRLIGLTALHHDLSLYDLFGAFIARAGYVIPDPECRRDPEHWAELISRHSVSIWNSVPAMMVMFTEGIATDHDYDLSSMRLVIHGGDWVPVDLPDRIWALMPQAAVLSIGGPTETTIWNIWNPVTTSCAHLPRIPYGMPTANSRYDIFDDQDAHRPNWVAGEMCCQGVGVTLGYWQDSERTAAKYARHPENKKTMFRTGDMGRYLPDGRIEILGRRDHQVKINGQRIELGEIESTLNQHPGVDRVLARVYKTPHGTTLLLGYAVLRNVGVSEGELMRHAANSLPSHMVPDQIVILESFPLSRNNKVDRSLLPDPPSAASAQPSAAVESSPLFRKIAGLVSETVGFDVADPEQAFTQLGIDSLDLVRLGNRLEREFDRRPRIDELFRLRNLKALTEYYDGESVADEDSGGRVAVGDSAIEQIIARFETIHDPDEKERFKKSQPGIRKDLGSRPYLELRSSRAGENDADVWLERRSSRQFLSDVISWEQVSDLLAILRPLRPGGEVKYRYASAGGLYPNQVYLYAKPGRVDGLPGGLYYYEPEMGRLVTMREDAVITSDIHVPFVNSPTADSSAFTLFIVADLSAIAPSYGEHSYRFATLEAGIMSHLLEDQAAQSGLGLCQIGSVEFDKIRSYFDLQDHHILLHTLLGGLKDDSEQHPWSVDDDDEEGVL